MNISLLPDLEEMVNRKVRSGEYDSPSEVVVHALYLLEARDRFSRGSARRPQTRGRDRHPAI